ncbi:MAG: SAM-dependent methyltransferase [Lautropia sp.]|nr:SAM-dependent methyltransferase [Lautropia sp.]
MTSAAGRLLLIPAPLEQVAEPRAWLCESDRQLAGSLARFYVETPKTARRWLKALPTVLPLQSLQVKPLPPADARTVWQEWLAPMIDGQTVGLLSDAGCPGVADPGALLVRAAHAAGIEVHPLIGPSSLLLALMASGLNGQRFSFQGYLPVERAERLQALERLSRRSAEGQETVVLIETPYRNQAMADSLLQALPGGSQLCIAVDLTGRSQSVLTRPVQAWRRAPPALPRKLPAVFLFLCLPASPAR